MSEIQAVKDRSVQVALGFIVLCMLVYILSAAKSLLVPLVVAIVIWYLINALAKYYHGLNLGGFKLPLGLCFLVSVATLGAGIWFIIQLVTNNIADVVKEAPVYQANLEGMFVDIMARFNLDATSTIEQLSSYVNFGNMARNIGFIFTNAVGTLLVITVYVVFLLIEQSTFSEKIARMIDDDAQEDKVRRVLANIDEKIRIYLGVKTVMSALTGTLSYIILSAVGVDFADFWGLMIFFLNFIPMIGSLIGVVFPALLTLVQFTDDPLTYFLIVSVGLGAVQMVIGNFLDPKMMGDNLNLSPIVIVLSLATWNMIWGVAGMFLSIPIMAIVAIIMSQFKTTRPFAVMMSKRGQINVEDGAASAPKKTKAKSKAKSKRKKVAAKKTATRKKK